MMSLRALVVAFASGSCGGATLAVLPPAGWTVTASAARTGSSVPVTIAMHAEFEVAIGGLSDLT